MTLLRAFLTGETDPFILTKYLIDEIKKDQSIKDLLLEIDEENVNALLETAEEDDVFSQQVQSILGRRSAFSSQDKDRFQELERTLDSLDYVLPPKYSNQINKIKESIKGKRKSSKPEEKFQASKETDMKKLLERIVSRLQGTDYLQRYKNVNFSAGQKEILDNWPELLYELRNLNTFPRKYWSKEIQEILNEQFKAEVKKERYAGLGEEASKTMKDEIARNEKKLTDLTNKFNQKGSKYLNDIKEMLDKEYAFGRPLKEVLKQIWKDNNKGKKFLPKQSREKIKRELATRGKTRSLDYWMKNMDKDMSQETKEALKPKLKLRLDSYNKKIETANKRHLEFYEKFASALKDNAFAKIKKNVSRAEEANRKYNSFRTDVLNFSNLYELIEGSSPGFDILPFTFNEAMDNLVSLISEYARRDNWTDKDNNESILEELAQSYSSQVNAIFEELGASELTRDYSGDTILQTIASNLREYLTQDESEIMKAHSPLLDSLDKKKAKRLKKILQAAEPSEYFGQDFAKLGELIKELKALGFIKEDKKKNKRLDTMDEKNVSVVATAAKLRKDYEVLYRQLRGIVYPKSAGGLND